MSKKKPLISTNIILKITVNPNYPLLKMPIQKLSITEPNDTRVCSVVPVQL